PIPGCLSPQCAGQGEARRIAAENREMPTVGGIVWASPVCVLTRKCLAAFTARGCGGGVSWAAGAIVAGVALAQAPVREALNIEPRGLSGDRSIRRDGNGAGSPRAVEDLRVRPPGEGRRTGTSGSL